MPRRYTLTHSDITGELFLTVGSQYNKRQISGLYTRLMRDEVLAELSDKGDGLVFRVYCHVSGGFVLGMPKWRYKIFQAELPLALEAIIYGDYAFFEQMTDLNKTPVRIYFESTDRNYKKVEEWGVIADYRH